MVSVKTLTIHITTPDYALLREIQRFVAELCTHHPEVIFEIGVTKAEEA